MTSSGSFPLPLFLLSWSLIYSPSQVILAAMHNFGFEDDSFSEYLPPLIVSVRSFDKELRLVF